MRIVFINTQQKQGLCSLLDAEENISKDEEKGEIIDAFLPQSLTERPAVLRATRPPELVDRDGEQTRCPAIQEKVVTCCATMHL